MSRLDQQARHDPVRNRRRFGVRAGIAFGCALLFAVLAALVRSAAGPVLRTDRATDDTLHGFALRHAGFTSAMRVVSDVGTTPAWIVILAPVVGWLLYRRLPKLAVFVVVTAAGSSLLNNAIKLLVGRARPHLADPVAVAAGKSFPSGHSQAAIVGYAILVAVFLPAAPRGRKPWLVVPAVLMVLLIGFSRIALGVHYLSDVIGAYLIGTVWFLGMAAAFGAWRRDEGKPTPAVAEGLEPDQGDRLTPG
ncbi:MAG TPA: phosphatase PAP2 family protein [Jatrophihabitans sp.]|nr:phosphatase PAP2 family protein [Jatrophihabitans sp.]